MEPMFDLLLKSFEMTGFAFDSRQIRRRKKGSNKLKVCTRNQKWADVTIEFTQSFKLSKSRRLIDRKAKHSHSHTRPDLQRKQTFLYTYTQLRKNGLRNGELQNGLEKGTNENWSWQGSEGAVSLMAPTVLLSHLLQLCCRACPPPAAEFVLIESTSLDSLLSRTGLGHLGKGCSWHHHYKDCSSTRACSREKKLRAAIFPSVHHGGPAR